MVIVESWGLDWEPFDGVWILDDCSASSDEAISAGCVVLALIVRIVANAVRQQWRGEDLRDDVAEAHEYIHALPLRQSQSRILLRLLSALTPFHPDRVTEELLGAAWQTRRDGLDRASRSLAELAYQTCRLYHLADGTAQGAALALARLALLDECPRTARRWRGIAHVHGRRAARRVCCSHERDVFAGGAAQPRDRAEGEP